MSNSYILRLAFGRPDFFVQVFTALLATALAYLSGFGSIAPQVGIFALCALLCQRLFIAIPTFFFMRMTAKTFGISSDDFAHIVIYAEEDGVTIEHVLATLSDSTEEEIKDLVREARNANA